MVLILCNGCPEKNLITFSPISQNKQKLDSSSQVDPLDINSSTLPFCGVWQQDVDMNIKVRRKEEYFYSLPPLCVFVSLATCDLAASVAG